MMIAPAGSRLPAWSGERFTWHTKQGLLMEFEKITVRSVKGSFIDEMLHKIVSGDLKPGDRLPSERDIAASTGISRSLVNQGLLELSSMGFVSVQPRHGTIVNDYRKYPTPESLAALMHYGSIDIDYPLFRDLMDFRLLIETECARLACANAYDTTLQKMQEQVERMRGGLQNTVDAQYQFHYRLMLASGNGVYCMIFRAFEPVIRALTERHYEVAADDWKTAPELHQNLLDAIRAKDGQRSVECVHVILEKGIAVLEEHYQ